jgi:hypothetical protein
MLGTILRRMEEGHLLRSSISGSRLVTSKSTDSRSGRLPGRCFRLLLHEQIQRLDLLPQLETATACRRSHVCGRCTACRLSQASAHGTGDTIFEEDLVLALHDG